MPSPRKRFGQNFLEDPSVIERIVLAVQPEHDDLLVEIGPGRGALTTALLPGIDRIHAIEIDRDLVRILENHYAAANKLVLHSADALSFDFASLKTSDQKLRIVGNLPYNIATPLLFHLFEQLDSIRDLHVMLQREVADRLTAKSGDAAYSKLTVLTQYHCQAEALFIVPPTAFYPVPKVHSAFVRLTPRPKLLPLPKLTILLQHAFSKRRKTLKNALEGILSPQTLKDLGIDPQQRPQDLSLEQYMSLANVLLISEV